MEKMKTFLMSVFSIFTIEELEKLQTAESMFFQLVIFILTAIYLAKKIVNHKIN